MKLFGIAGWSGMGKATLLERLLPEFIRRGMRVSLIKHSHKDIEIDRPGKDSHRLREAGCSEVLLLGASRWALMHELRQDPEPPLRYLVSRLQHCDLVLIEGFKSGSFPKLEVWRAALGKPPLWLQQRDIVGWATEGEWHGAESTAPPPPRLPLDDVPRLAGFVLDQAVAVQALAG